LSSSDRGDFSPNSPHGSASEGRAVFQNLSNFKGNQMKTNIMWAIGSLAIQFSVIYWLSTIIN
jgi:hypothetical protein